MSSSFGGGCVYEVGIMFAIADVCYYATKETTHVSKILSAIVFHFYFIFSPKQFFVKRALLRGSSLPFLLCILLFFCADFEHE